MSTDLMNQFQATQSVLEKKELLEKEIREEKLKVRVHECRLKDMQEKMNVKKLNYYDRGRTRGWRFTIIGLGSLAIYLPFFFFQAVKSLRVNSWTEISYLLLILFFVIQPLLVGVPVLRAYYRGQEKRRQEAAEVEAQYQIYMNDTAGPEIQKSKARIAELMALEQALMSEHEAVVDFLPEKHRNIFDVRYMMECVERGTAADIQTALKRCGKERAYRKHMDEVHRKEAAHFSSLGLREDCAFTKVSSRVVDSIIDVIMPG